MPDTDTVDSIKKAFDNVEKRSYNVDGDGTSPSSFKDKCMKIIQPPCVYFIVLFFLIAGTLYYNQPCFILSSELDPKTNKQKIDFKMLGMYSIAITALIGFGIHPYISKKNKKTE